VAKASSSKKPASTKGGTKVMAGKAANGKPAKKPVSSAAPAGKRAAAAAAPVAKTTTKQKQLSAPAKMARPAPPPTPVPVKSAKPAPAAVPSREITPLARHAKSRDREERKGVLVAAPVPTDTKPAKNRAGLKSSELEHYRDLLLAKRRELVGDMSSMEREALNRGGSSNLSNLPMHMADMGTDNYEQEFTLGLMEKDRNLLREINAALGKIQDGSYGICEGTGLPIGKPRLEAQPWAKYSIEHARKLEQRGVR
jgi:DnaK suppressor protein